ncbi:hypothetical protein AKJ59_00515 [candidate division MSBL1 archaeon SCGC-AAA385M02]|uniref:Uncharacterized protein n=1 Tax=candidate division MSBL1 archaeon SCGC-AAA385M02 TaxID=1698287 RepID=A0A133VQU3_9EURY|nr:hypothetical protein AKJ59_00515 [candidate division MSBL1 archaeon SCGC-AAA385M02]
MLKNSWCPLIKGECRREYCVAFQVKEDTLTKYTHASKTKLLEKRRATCLVFGIELPDEFIPAEEEEK